MRRSIAEHLGRLVQLHIPIALEIIVKPANDDDDNIEADEEKLDGQGVVVGVGEHPEEE